MKDNDFIKVFDLTTDEGFEGYNEQLKELSKQLDSSIFKYLGINQETLINGLKQIGEEIHNASKKENNKIEKPIDTKQKEKEESKFTRPSDLLSVDKKLQIHKIVQEYVDTMVKPFNNGQLTDNQINDAYAGLFEFACWIMNR